MITEGHILEGIIWMVDLEVNIQNPSLCFLCRLHARFYELAPNLVPMDYRKSPIVHVPMSLIIQMPELRVLERPPLPGRAWEEPEEAGLGGWGLGECASVSSSAP